MTVDKNDRPDQRPPEINSSNIVNKGFGDPSGSFPRKSYLFEQSVNKSNRGRTRNELIVGGGNNGNTTELTTQLESKYPYNNVEETVSGHVIEFDDTPGGERILIKHRTGSGIELRADGSMLMSTGKNMVQTIAGNSNLIVEGQADMTFDGDLNLKVSGDLNIDVGGNFTVSTGGTKNEITNGSSRETVYGTKGTIVRGSRSDTTLGTVTRSSLGALNEIVKGNYRNSVQGSSIIASKGVLKVTSEGELALTSPNANIAANNLSVFGASGTIGGEGIVQYGKTFYGTSFYGDLVGTAKFAVQADVTNSQSYPSGSVGSASGYIATDDGTETAQPTSDILNDYVNNGGNGVQKIQIDEGDHIKNLIDRTVENEGTSNKPLSTTEVRSILREPKNLGNSNFTGNMVSAGKLSPKFVNKVANNFGRVTNGSGTPVIPSQPLNEVKTLAKIDRITPNQNTSSSVFNVNPRFDVNTIDSDTPITGKIEIAQGIRLSKFLGGIGEKVTLSHISTREEKLKIARNFTQHAQAMKTVLEDKGQFANHRLVVVEGLYKKGPKEELTTDSTNDLATKGRVVVYELHDKTGNPDPEATYNLAIYWKDNLLFDELQLDYDTFDPNGNMSVQIVLIMPEVDKDWKISGKYQMKLKTLYNGNVQGNELIEILEA
jgi:hypothetical protein